MSLLKQLFLAICLFLVVAFTGSFIASVETSREQLLSQLRSHAQDAATDLDRVVVSASTSRVPYSEAALPNTITVIDRAALEQQLALTQE